MYYNFGLDQKHHRQEYQIFRGVQGILLCKHNNILIEHIDEIIYRV